jgi:hypothetical protein
MDRHDKDNEWNINLRLSQRVEEYLGDCDSATLVDFGVLCFGVNDPDVKALATCIGKELDT